MNTTTRPIYFYGTRHDMLRGFARAEASLSVKYVRSDLSDSPDPESFSIGSDLPYVGSLRRGDHVGQPTYVVLQSDQEFVVRPVPQRRGGTKYAFDSMMNPGSFTFRPAGSSSDHIHIYGLMSFGDRTSTSGSDEMFAIYSRLFFEGVKKIKNFSLMPEALRLFEQGERFTSSVKAKPEMDLAR